MRSISTPNGSRHALPNPRCPEANTLVLLRPRTAITLGQRPTLVVSMTGCTVLNGSRGEMTIGAGTFMIVHGDQDVLLCTESDSTTWVLELPLLVNWGPFQRMLPEGFGQVPESGGEVLRRLSERSCLSREDALALTDMVRTAWQPFIAACPGKLLSRKLQVFERLQRARLFMLGNVGSKLRISDIAVHVNYTVCHFTKVYSSTFGRCPKLDLHLMKLDQAGYLLRTTELAVSDVALSAGFEHASVFARFFKRHHGMSASEYRKSIHRRGYAASAGESLNMAPAARTE